MKLRRSYLWALVILLAIGGWMASGVLQDRGDGSVASTAPQEEATQDAPALPAVRVQTLKAMERHAELVVRGRTEAVRRVTLRGETPGTVIATPLKKGSFVPKGSLVCQLDVAEREARIAEARAAVAQAQLDFDASVQLMKRGYAAATEEAARKARLDASMAALKRAEIDLGRTRIRTPFAGVIETQDAKTGDYVGIGDACATMVDLDPILIVAQVSERDVGKLSVGMPGTATLVDGSTVDGTIRFISNAADVATRTFRFELAVENADRSIKDGLTAQIAVPLAPTVAHRLSPSILTLGDDGKIGVRTIDDDGVVSFNPLAIAGDDPDGIWVSGLPDTVTVITVGQEFVEAGQKVRPVFSTAEANQ